MPLSYLARLVLPIALCTAASSSALAQTQAFSTSLAGNDTFGGTLGVDFWVESTPLVVTALGAFDQNGDGLAHAISVRLYDIGTGGADVLLGDLSLFGTAGTLSGGFRMMQLATPITLLANHAYQIAASGYGPGEMMYNADLNGRAPVGSDRGNARVFYLGSRYSLSAGQSANVNRGGNPPAVAYAAGNFVFSDAPTNTVPEPATIGLTALGLALVGAGARRRRVATS
jgi:hypothetical protein